MTIRTRLTLWYAGIMFISLLAMGVLSYHAFAPEPRDHSHHNDDGKKNPGDNESDQNDALQIVFWCGVPAAMLALVGGWWFMRRALKPVTALTQAAEGIDERTLSKQLPRSGNGDELDRLTEVFNAMTVRLNNSFQRVHEFTLHASHELKTPLAIIHGEIETELGDSTLTVIQRERLLSQLDEIQRLAKIVDGLTLLTKADAGQIKLSRELVPFDELVREACDDAQVLARPTQIKVLLTHCEKLVIEGDRHRLRQMLLNLTDNAIKYSPPNGHLKIDLQRENNTATLSISNSTAGLDTQLLPRLFDRFFRGDASHNNQVDGCGLGLSIVQWIVTAHGGAIDLTLGADQDFVVAVRLPIANYK